MSESKPHLGIDIRSSINQSMMMSIPIGEFEHQVREAPQVYNLTLGPAEKCSDRENYYRYPIFQDGVAKSYHRYSEFDQLRTTLIATYPGYCFPVLPDKEGLSSYWSAHSDEFIRYRRHGLEQFLQYCAKHPVIRKTD
mmetsp:Transcript_26251/g.46941  ORF Transcript_26251/g.46941 Transcript_26251/m.46941 type:complete len:138 (+) Transcript_26251:855-1268(+)